jgi:transposase, IS6 family
MSGSEGRSEKYQQWQLVGFLSYNMVRKGQMRGVEKGDIMGQVSFIARLFGVAA